MSDLVITGGEGEENPRDIQISDLTYFGSTIGNAYFSGMSFDQLWSCVTLADSREALDEAVSATIILNEIIDAYTRRTS